jgi:hypothetical protein
MVNQTLTAPAHLAAMRSILAIALLSLALAAPAGAQDGGRLRIPAKAAEAPALRGAADAPDAPAGDLSDLIPAPLPARPIASSAPRDNRQCRRACSMDYYFCLSGEDDRCPQVWTKCLAACG